MASDRDHFSLSSFHFSLFNCSIPQHPRSKIQFPRSDVIGSDRIGYAHAQAPVSINQSINQEHCIALHCASVNEKRVCRGVCFFLFFLFFFWFFGFLKKSHRIEVGDRGGKVGRWEVGYGKLEGECEWDGVELLEYL